MPTSLEGEGDGPDYGTMGVSVAEGQGTSLANGSNASGAVVTSERVVGEVGVAVGEQRPLVSAVAADESSVVITTGAVPPPRDEPPPLGPSQLASVEQTMSSGVPYDPLARPSPTVRSQVVEPSSTMEQVTQQVMMGEVNFSPPEDLPGAHDARASQQNGLWLFRLGEFVQRRVSQAGAMVSPLLENRSRPEPPQQHPNLTPPGSWTAASPRPRLFTAAAEQQMAQWVRKAPLLYGASHQQPQSASSRESLTQEQIVTEVQRQVRQQLLQHEERQQTLLAENQQLRDMVGRLLSQAPTLDSQGGGGTEVALGPQETVVNREVTQGGTLEAPVHRQGRLLGDPPGLQPNAGDCLRDVSEGARRSQDLPRHDHGVYRGNPSDHQGVPDVAGGDPPGLGAGVPQGSGGGGSATGASSGAMPKANTIPGVTKGSTTAPLSAPGDPMSLLVQGMAQLQQAYLGRPEGDLKGTVDLPSMPEVGPDAAVEFSDWIYEAEQAIGSLSDRAALWFSACLEVAHATYDTYVTSTPLQRLSLTPEIPLELKDQKWSRLERKVMTLLLNAMKKTAKDEVITYRISSVPALLYRMYVLYQPGGAAERTTILKHLEGQAASEDVQLCVAALRRWRRYWQRAEDIGISVPDASVLLRSVEQISKRALEAHPELKFRVALTKNELALHSRPETDSVIRYYNTILAELQTVAPTKGTSTTTATTDAAKLKAVTSSGGRDQPGDSSLGSPKNRSQLPCKFFLTDSGCSKGAGCQFSHNFAKKEKAGRCWTCGSTQHQQAACPVKKGGNSPNGRAPKGASKGTAVAQLAASMATAPSGTSEPSSAASTLSSASSSTPSGGTNPVNKEEPSVAAIPESEIRQLLTEANAMLKEMRQLKGMSLSSTRVENEAVAHGCNPTTGRSGLLDSGASHPFRMASEEEVSMADRVNVQLANGSEITLAQNAAGTLLKTTSTSDAYVAPIVPLGSLVQDLGCDLQWTRRKGLEIRHPQHGIIRPQVVGRCPLVGEACALELIQELEERKVQTLRDSTNGTQRRLWMWDRDKEWAAHLDEFLRTGTRATQLLALSARDSPFASLSDVEKGTLSEQIDLSDSAGWNYLKAVPCSRQRRKITADDHALGDPLVCGQRKEYRSGV